MKPEMRLIAALITGPVALLANLEAGFALAPWVCNNHREPVLHIVHLVFLAIAAGAGWIAWSGWRATGSEWPGEDAAAVSRERFLAIIGLIAAALSCLQILGSIAMSFIVGACR